MDGRCAMPEAAVDRRTGGAEEPLATPPLGFLAASSRQPRERE
jgi:hypothetical protein